MGAIGSKRGHASLIAAVAEAEIFDVLTSASVSDLEVSADNRNSALVWRWDIIGSARKRGQGLFGCTLARARPVRHNVTCQMIGLYENARREPPLAMNPLNRAERQRALQVQELRCPGS